MPSSNPSKDRAEQYRKYLRSRGWKPTVLNLFGVDHEAWLNPRNGRPSMLRSAHSNERAREKKAKEKKARKK